jgi:SNF2 family DNA or RNA helicase
MFACEMGTGKTLVVLSLLEALKAGSIWYVAPKTVLPEIENQIEEWGFHFPFIRFMTYDGLKVAAQTKQDAPQAIVFDESPRIKTPEAQRSQAAMHVANASREEHGNNSLLFAMSGSPAPKSPLDWWHQIEVIRPGYLREGSLFAFRDRLAVTEEREGLAHGKFTRVVAWKTKGVCSVCGLGPDMHTTHPYEESDELGALHRRLSRIAKIVFKRDCLDLPEKIYREIKIPVSEQTKRHAALIRKVYPRAATQLNMLRQLSDGFQYKDVDAGMEVCPNCNGKGVVRVEDRDCDCDVCAGAGERMTTNRVAVYQNGNPKEAALIDLLEEFENRVIVYAGYTASVDACVQICRREGWSVIRVDGRGWAWCSDEALADTSPATLLKEFQKDDARKIAFVGQPEAAGMGLTLTASPVIIFYSNSYSGEARIQAEDRIHRPGSKGCLIIDLMHLGTDELILQNLRQKKRLQDITLGDIQASEALR